MIPFLENVIIFAFGCRVVEDNITSLGYSLRKMCDEVESTTVLNLGECKETKAAVVQEDARISAPWAAAIFKKNAEKNNDWEFLCSGTITGRYTIITAARCLLPRVYGPKLSSRPHHIRYADLQVVAGLPTTELNSKDQYTQFGIVGQIRDTFDANANGDTPEGDLAAIRLANLFNFSTPYVKPVLLFEQAGTLLEVNETKAGEVLLVAGYENPSLGGIKTRAKDAKGSPLKVTQVVMEDTASCIERYTEAYPTYYFNVGCGKMQKKSDVIPCQYQGSGLVKKVEDEGYYLFGVYSSNSALAKTEGTLVEKNKMTPTPCTSVDTIFFSKYAHLKRWGISSNFCDNDLAMCANDRCRPWADLCSGQSECDDGSDEVERVCYNQNKPDCAGDQGNKNSFRCTYGGCIDKKYVCDGIKNCNDGTDEDKNGVCKGRPAPAANSTCEGIKIQQSVSAYCSLSDGKTSIPCSDPVPLGTVAVLRSKEIVVNCQRDGKWSRSTRLTC